MLLLRNPRERVDRQRLRENDRCANFMPTFWNTAVVFFLERGHMHEHACMLFVRSVGFCCLFLLLSFLHLHLLCENSRAYVDKLRKLMQIIWGRHKQRLSHIIISNLGMVMEWIRVHGNHTRPILVFSPCPTLNPV